MQHAQAIAFAKWSIWVKNLKCQKQVRVVLCKKPLEKTLNIPEMRKFQTSAIWQKAIAHAKPIAFAKWSMWV